MEIINSLSIFIENILNMKIGLSNITILDLCIYLIFVGSITTFIKISVKGKR